jgi:uncharacterized membrane protein
MLTPIIIFTLLSSPLLIALIYSKVNDHELDVNKYASWSLGIAFIFFSIGHIAKTQGMVDMLPTWLPSRFTLVYATELLELLIGIALFTPKFQRQAAKLAIAVFIVFFPANIYAALNYIGLGGHQWGPIYLAIRAPLQLILITWAYFLCVKNRVNK